MQWSKTRSVGIPLKYQIHGGGGEFQNISDATRVGRSVDNLPTPELSSCHYSQETLTFPVIELSKMGAFESRK